MVLSDESFSLSSNSHSNPVNNFRRRRKIWRNSSSSSSSNLKSQSTTEITSTGSQDCPSSQSTNDKVRHNNRSSRGRNQDDKSSNRKQTSQTGYSKRGRPYTKELPMKQIHAWTYLPDYDAPIHHEVPFNEETNEYFGSHGIIYTTEPTSHSTSSNAVTPTEALRSRIEIPSDYQAKENGFCKSAGYVEGSMPSSTSLFGFHMKGNDDPEEKLGVSSSDPATIIIVNSQEELVRAISERYND